MTFSIGLLASPSCRMGSIEPKELTRFGSSKATIIAPVNLNKAKLVIL